MPKVHHVKAAKDYPEIGVKKGEMYYHWTFKNQRGPGTKVKSKVRPRASQLTRSAFYSEAYSINEQIGDIDLSGVPIKERGDSLTSEIESLKERAESLRDETQEKFDNLPENFQGGSSGEQLQERVDACESFINDLDGITVPEYDPPTEEEEDEEDEEDGDELSEYDSEYESQIDDALNELTALSIDT